MFILLCIVLALYPFLCYIYIRNLLIAKKHNNISNFLSGNSLIDVNEYNIYLFKLSNGIIKKEHELNDQYLNDIYILLDFPVEFTDNIEIANKLNDISEYTIIENNIYHIKIADNEDNFCMHKFHQVIRLLYPTYTKININYYDNESDYILLLLRKHINVFNSDTTRNFFVTNMKWLYLENKIRPQNVCVEEKIIDNNLPESSKNEIILQLYSYVLNFNSLILNFKMNDADYEFMYIELI